MALQINSAWGGTAPASTARHPLGDARFGAHLRSERQRLGLSPEALAYRSGVSRSSITRMEVGTRSPSYEMAETLATALYPESIRKRVAFMVRAGFVPAEMRESWAKRLEGG